jgi:two-component system OmpR family response regulator
MTTGFGLPTDAITTRGSRPLTVLVLEDDADQRELLAIHFRRAGCTVLATGRSAEALELLRPARPDLAVVDVHLPGSTGDDVVERLRAEVPTCRVVLSSRWDRSAFPAAADVLTKPFTAAQVLGLIPRRPQSFLPAPRSGSGR